MPPSSVSAISASTAVTLNTSGDATGTAAITANEVDWYKFTVGAGSSKFSASTPTSNLDTVIAVYNAAGQRVAYNDDIAYPNTDSAVSVTLASGTYYLGVTNYTRTAGGAYTWAIDGPSVATTDDAYENNDTQAAATVIGTVSASRTLTGLVMADAADWYQVTTVATGGTANNVSISFNNAQGNLDLRLVNSAGTVLATSASTTGSTETISLSGRAAGTYWIQVFGAGGAFNPSYTLTINPPASPPPPPPPPPPTTTGGFQITLRTSGLTANQQAIFQQAANRWAQVITGDLPDATYNGVVVDDLLIDASSVAIDGAGGVLGQAGPDRLRSGSLLPYHGTMQFDTADLASLEASGGLYYTVLHEMGHVLGIGTIWSSLGLLSGAGGTNPVFTGAQAVAAYNSIFGTTATGVPVENSGGSGTRDAHWRESIFGNEVMTGYLNSGVNPLSRVTIGSLADLGYAVNLAAADAYTPPGRTALAAPVTSTSGTAALQAPSFGSRPGFAPTGFGRYNHESGSPRFADPLESITNGIRVDANHCPLFGQGSSDDDGFDVIHV